MAERRTQTTGQTGLCDRWLCVEEFAIPQDVIGDEILVYVGLTNARNIKKDIGAVVQQRRLWCFGHFCRMGPER